MAHIAQTWFYQWVKEYAFHLKDNFTLSEVLGNNVMCMCIIQLTDF